MGLERLASVLQGVATNYDTDLFTPIHARMRELMRHDPEAFESERFSYQVIADHSRAITFLIADGVLPANEGRGYVLRRIVRRAVRHGRLLGRREPFLAETAKVVIELMGEAYPVLVERREAILGAIIREETAFARTLDAGTVQLEEALIPLTGADRVVGRRPEEVPEDGPHLDGETAFRLHDTYGFPIDLTVELAALGFFAARGHEVVPSASLVPGGDQTLLFTNSGMVQFKDVFRGVEKRSYTRAVDAQRCLRVAGKHNDFEEVGRTPRHHTLFEMLGNWSFGDYFKREAIHWAWEFLTEDLGIPGERLAATTYRDDEESWAVWRDEIGLPPERMARWGDVDAGRRQELLAHGRDGALRSLQRDPLRPRRASSPRAPTASPTTASTARAGWRSGTSSSWSSTSSPTGRACRCRSRSVDTGMGLERLASVLQGVATNYDTDLFTPIHARMRELMGHDPDAFESERFSYQVIADHSRAITFLIADGVLPANEGRGYVLRRIVRRAVRHGRLLGRREPFLAETAKVVIELMGEAYPILVERREAILGAIIREETAFARTLDAGTRPARGGAHPADRRRPRRGPPSRGRARGRARASTARRPSACTTRTASPST